MDSLPEIAYELAGKRIQDLQSSEPDVPKYLYESGRCAISHAYSDPVADPDDASVLRRLSQDILVVKAIAVQLIESELWISRCIMG
jgi:hypothetical protein